MNPSLSHIVSAVGAARLHGCLDSESNDNICSCEHLGCQLLTHRGTVREYLLEKWCRGVEYGKISP